MSSLLRRIISIVLIAGLITAIIFGLLWLRLNNAVKSDSHVAIPPGFVLCLETSDYTRLISGLQNHSNIWQEFLRYDMMTKLNSQIHEIDSLIRKFPDVGNLFTGEVLISVHRVEDDYDFLFVLNSPEEKATDEVLKLISDETGIDKKKHENTTIYNLEIPDNIPDQLSFTETKGLFLLSSDEELLKLSIANVNLGENVFQTGKYEKIRSTLGSDVEAHLYLNFSKLEDLAAMIVSKEKVPRLSRFTSSAALDVEIKPGQLLFNGFSALNDSTIQQLSLFSGQSAVEQALFRVIPSTVVYFKWLGVSDPVAFLSNIRESDPQPAPVNDFREVFFSLFGGQAVEFIIRKEMETFSRFILISVKSKGQTENHLREYLLKLSQDEKLHSKSISIDENTIIDAFKFPVSGIEKTLFHNLFPESGYEWYCFYDNNLVLAESVADIKEFGYLNSLGKTLQNDDYFQGLKDNFSSRSNFFIYFDPSQYYSEILKFLQPSASSVIEKNAESWKKLNVVGFQSTVADKLHYFRFFINYTGKIREYVNTVWERKLEGNLAIKPTVVLNHNNKEKEIFVQDKKNFIYLINNTGGILWKQKIDDHILGKVRQIDYYGNGKLQYLFNTTNKIYLIDRNGNNVEKFPVSLRQKASAGLALFDYDNNGHYRIPVPTVERDILMYDKHGSVVSGWRFRQSDQVISSPLQHHRIGDKDYIVAKDEFNLYILNRRGRNRVKYSQQIDFSVNNPVYFMKAYAGKSEGLIVSDKGGDVYAFYFDGSMEKLMEQEMAPDHFFIPSDLNGDNRTEYIFQDSTKMKVFDHKAKLIFSEVYPEAVTLPPVIYSFSATDKKIGVVASNSGRIYLVNNDGSLYQGFPLQGSSLFSISSFPGLKDRFNLLVGNKDNFLYNYSVK